MVSPKNTFSEASNFIILSAHTPLESAPTTTMSERATELAQWIFLLLVVAVLDSATEVLAGILYFRILKGTEKESQIGQHNHTEVLY